MEILGQFEDISVEIWTLSIFMECAETAQLGIPARLVGPTTNISAVSTLLLFLLEYCNKCDMYVSLFESLVGPLLGRGRGA